MVKIKPVLFLVLIVLVVFPHRARAAIINAQSTSYAHVSAAVSSASNGDTVVIPAGSSVWASTLTVNKAITLQGAGMGNTIIINSQGDGGVPSSGEFNVLNMTLTSAGRMRVTGIEFNMNYKGNGIVMNGTGNFADWREGQVDRCKFLYSRGKAIETYGFIKGLLYSNLIVDCTKTIDVYHGTGYGSNPSWSNYLTMGTVSNVVYEDNAFEYRDWMHTIGAIALTSRGHGGRSIMRYNTMTNFSLVVDFRPLIDMHGNQRAVTNNYGEHRGGRQFEMYGNVFNMIRTDGLPGNSTLEAVPFSLRGGLAFICSNRFYGTNMAKTISFLEEDSCSRFSYLAGPPGYDWQRLYFWENYCRDENFSSWAFVSFGNTACESPFFGENVNVFFSAPPSSFTTSPDAGGSFYGVTNYTMLAYPHPWRDASPVPETTNILTFASSSYTISEDVGTLTVTVQRTSGTNGAIGCTYTTLDGTALAGTDYVTASNTLSWLDGDATNKTFDITITDRAGEQSSRSFNLQLLLPTGDATIGTPSLIQATINDADDATPPTISNLSSNVPNYNTATITWETDEPATNMLLWGTTASYGNTQYVGEFIITGHEHILSALTPETEYHFLAIVGDQFGNTNHSGDFTFTTTAQPTGGTNGLMAWWKLDEGSGTNIADSSGNGFDGYTVGNMTWFSPGKIGNSIYSNGDGDHIEFPSFNVETNDAITLACWVQVWGFTNNHKFITKSQGSLSVYNYNYFLGTDTDGLLVFGITGEDTNLVKIIAYGDLPFSQWAHVAGTYDGAQMKVYIDGQFVNSENKSGGLREDDAPIWLFDNPTNGTRQLIGMMDDVRIYNYALSPQEVYDLYSPPTLRPLRVRTSTIPRGFRR